MFKKTLISEFILIFNKIMNATETDKIKRFSKVDLTVLLYISDKTEAINGLKIFKGLIKSEDYSGSNSTIYSSLYKLNGMGLITKECSEPQKVQGGRKTFVYAISEKGKRAISDMQKEENFEPVLVAT